MSYAFPFRVVKSLYALTNGFHIAVQTRSGLVRKSPNTRNPNPRNGTDLGGSIAMVLRRFLAVSPRYHDGGEVELRRRRFQSWRPRGWTHGEMRERGDAREWRETVLLNGRF